MANSPMSTTRRLIGRMESGRPEDIKAFQEHMSFRLEAMILAKHRERRIPRDIDLGALVNQAYFRVTTDGFIQKLPLSHQDSRRILYDSEIRRALRDIQRPPRWRKTISLSRMKDVEAVPAARATTPGEIIVASDLLCAIDAILNARERQILAQLLRGATRSEIAAAMSLPHKAAGSMLQRFRAKIRESLTRFRNVP